MNLDSLIENTMPPSNSLLKSICIETPLSIYRQFFGCPASLTRRCGVEGSSPLLDSSGSGTCIFTLLVFSGIRIVTLLVLLVLLACFLIACLFLRFWFVWAYTPWFLGRLYKFLPWTQIVERIGIQKNVSEHTVAWKVDAKAIHVVRFLSYVIIV